MSDLRVIKIIALLWFVLICFLSSKGYIEKLGHVFMPLFAVLTVSLIAIPFLAYKKSSTVKREVDKISLKKMTKVHAWRIVAGLLFIYYGLKNQLPLAFWLLAGIGDIIVGVMALQFWKETPTPAIDEYKLFHQIGLLDFVIAVGTGITFTLLGDQKILLLTKLPLVLIPLFLVPFMGASHLISLSKL